MRNESIECILKNKDCFVWWSDNTNRQVWRKMPDDPNDFWQLVDPTWVMPNVKYLQNDNYCDFRIAEADGSDIEYRTKSGEWESCKSPIFNLSRHRYRIKPDWRWEDDLVKGHILCEVYDNERCRDGRYGMVTDYQPTLSHPYRVKMHGGMQYKYAEPVKASALKPFQLEPATS